MNSNHNDTSINNAVNTDREGSANLDPISGTPGAHPIGTGLGAALGGAAAGAATGTVVGPVGTVIGAAVGAVIGGLAGKGVAEAVDPTVEENYWRDNFSNRPYVESNATYDDYGPAYSYGVGSFGINQGRSFDEAEPHLSRDWHIAKGTSNLTWDKAKHASRDAWNKVSDATEQAIPGDSDRDGK